MYSCFIQKYKGRLTARTSLWFLYIQKKKKLYTATNKLNVFMDRLKQYLDEIGLNNIVVIVQK